MVSAKQGMAQTAALTKKNFVLLWRARRSTLCELIVPGIFMIFMGVLDMSIMFGTPDANPDFITELKSEGIKLPCYLFDDENGKYGKGRPNAEAWCVPMIFAPYDNPEVLETAYWLSYWAQALPTAIIISRIVYVVGLAFDFPIFAKSVRASSLK